MPCRCLHAFVDLGHSCCGVFESEIHDAVVQPGKECDEICRRLSTPMQDPLCFIRITSNFTTTTSDLPLKGYRLAKPSQFDQAERVAVGASLPDTCLSTRACEPRCKHRSFSCIVTSYTERARSPTSCAPAHADTHASRCSS